MNGRYPLKEVSSKNISLPLINVDISEVTNFNRFHHFSGIKMIWNFCRKNMISELLISADGMVGAFKHVFRFMSMFVACSFDLVDI